MRNSTDKTRFRKFLLVVTLPFLAIAPLLSAAQDNDRTIPASFEYEQCAMLWQSKLDRAATVCLANAEKLGDEATGQCLQQARRAYEADLRMCPLDTGFRPRR